MILYEIGACSSLVAARFRHHCSGGNDVNVNANDCLFDRNDDDDDNAVYALRGAFLGSIRLAEHERACFASDLMEIAHKATVLPSQIYMLDVCQIETILCQRKNSRKS